MKEFDVKSLSMGTYGPNKITLENALNLSVAPCSVNRLIYDALTSMSSLVLFGFKSPNWQLDAV